MTRPSGITPTIKRARLMEYSSRQEVKMDTAISKVKFVGWINPPKYWEPWVQKLCPDHQSTWKDAGIYEAVMSSTYAIKFHDGLILELVSRWCSQTNTFVFPWGEATLTLQDLLVLGGFSSLGISPLSSLENDVESLKTEEQLELAAKEIRTSTRTKIARQTKWMEKFIGSGSDLEHAAFLSLWLSRFVYPWGSSCGNIINRQVFPIAARLSRGIKIALAPAVLAMLYGELTALKKRLHSTQLVDQLGNEERPIELCALFHLVQIWAWERFPVLKPVPDRICSGEDFPRLARWSNVKISNDKGIRSAIDSSEKAFLWCPYGAFAKLEGRDLESFARCTETSELVGFDCCTEMYQPQRVIRQFRLDGDIPTDNIAEATNRNTSASFQPTVAACFEKWRKQKRCSTSSQVKVENMVDCDPPPGFPPRIEVPSVGNSDSDKDCSVTMIEHPNLLASKTVSRRAFPSSVASSDSDVAVEVKDTRSMHKIEEPERASIQQTFPLTSAQIKEEADENCVPPSGFPPHVEVPSVGNSDSDKDCSVAMIEHPKTVSRRAFPSSFASSDSDVAIEVKDMRSMHKIEEPERASTEQTFPLTSAQIKEEADENCVPHGFVSGAKRVSIDGTDEDNDGQPVSPPFDDESIEAMDIVNRSIHEKGNAVDAKHNEIEVITGRSTGSLGAESSFPQNELSTSCDAESHTNERSKDSDLDLEARISRLENIVYAHVKALEAAR